MAASPSTAPTIGKLRFKKQHGLAFWMARVLEECDRVAAKFAADPVHDLRVALRRCRSMADGLMAFDPDPSWKQMKRAGKKLFSSLGELRDVQVMEEWVNKLGSPDDLVTGTLLRHLDSSEAQHKQTAGQALQEFDRKQWQKWAKLLPTRAARTRSGSLLFKHLALERWTEAYRLHRQALRSGSQLSWHALRIGLKRFRYIVENFLPDQHEAWISDLKEMQDLLGELHDLDVLWNTALQIRAFPDPESRLRWHQKIIEERTKRIQQYRLKMVGQHSLWQLWRDQLPKDKQIETAALNRLKVWASVLDPDFRHSRHVARLALQLYDGMTVNGRDKPEHAKERKILQIAGLLHDVGFSAGKKRHQKASYRMIRRLTPPLGLDQEVLQMAAVVSRYHCAALPRSGQKAFARVPAPERPVVQKLAGILRLANAFDADHEGQIQRLEATAKNGYFVIAAQGYDSRSRMAEDIAAGRHLLELACRRPILVKRLAAPRITTRIQS